MKKDTSMTSAILPVVIAAHDLLSRCADGSSAGRDFSRLSSGGDRQGGQVWTGSFALCVVPWLLDLGAYDAAQAFLERLAQAESAESSGRIPALVVVDAKAVQAIQRADDRLLPPSLRQGEVSSGAVFNAPCEALSPEIAFLFAAVTYQGRAGSPLASIQGSVQRVVGRLLKVSGDPDRPIPLSFVDAIVFSQALTSLDAANAWRIRDRYIEKNQMPLSDWSRRDSLAPALLVAFGFDRGRIDLGRLAEGSGGLLRTNHPLPDSLGGRCATHPWILSMLIVALAKKGYWDESVVQLEALAVVLRSEGFTLGIDADGSSISVRSDLATAAAFVRAVNAVHGKSA